MKSYRIIFHIDMNAFFAACEVAEDPSLQGKAVAVARQDPLMRGIILSSTYEARKFGIKTTMLVKDALLLCPELVVVEPHMDIYDRYSKKFFEYFYTITPIVEPASIDEGYLDVTDYCDNSNPIKLASDIQKYLYEELKLPCSIGIAPNKFLAKMASDMKKPLGITVLRKREIPKYLWPLKIEDMYGVGKKTSPRLRAIGINTIGDLANYKDKQLLNKTVGNLTTEYLMSRANGNDDSQVEYQDSAATSVSNSLTFDHNTGNEKLILSTLRMIGNSVAHRLQASKYKARTIGIQLKYDDFTSITRGMSTDKPINDENDVYKYVKELFEFNYESQKDVRLVGVYANRLVEVESEVVQYSIFDDLSKVEKDNEILHILSDLQDKFGNNSIDLGINKKEGKNDNRNN